MWLARPCLSIISNGIFWACAPIFLYLKFIWVSVFFLVSIEIVYWKTFLFKFSGKKFFFGGEGMFYLGWSWMKGNWLHKTVAKREAESLFPPLDRQTMAERCSAHSIHLSIASGRQRRSPRSDRCRVGKAFPWQLELDFPSFILSTSDFS